MPAATGELAPPKRILVRGRLIRLRWLQQIIWSFLAANVGALIIAALYYLIIQVRWQMAVTFVTGWPRGTDGRHSL